MGELDYRLAQRSFTCLMSMRCYSFLYPLKYLWKTNSASYKQQEVFCLRVPPVGPDNYQPYDDAVNERVRFLFSITKIIEKSQND